MAHPDHTSTGPAACLSRTILDQLPAAAVAIAGEAVLAINHHARRLFTIDPAVGPGSPLVSLIGGLSFRCPRSGALLPAGSLPVQQALDGATATRELVFLTAAGERHLQCTAAPLVVDGHRLGATVIFADVSGAMEDCATLRHAMEELELFSSAAAHDLQDPLRLIISYLTLLERRNVDRLDAASCGYLTRAVEYAASLQRLITDLHAFAHAGARQSAMVPLALDSLVGEARARLQTAVLETGAVIGSDALPWILGDRVQLIRVFQNLLGNAIKYRHPGVTPRITVRATCADGLVQVAVQDNGLGIDPAQREAIFDAFRRITPVDSVPGSGLGLSICRRIVHQHGGRIRVESLPGEGSTFHFTLPAAAHGPVGTAAMVPGGTEAGGTETERKVAVAAAPAPAA